MPPESDGIDPALQATMRISKILSTDQDLVARFLAALGKGLVIAGHSKTARPGFFIFASNFIREYLEPEYLKKEGVLLQALEDSGFPGNEGPVGAMRREHQKSREISQTLYGAARAWQAGDESGRAEVVWATSQYTDLMRHHFERLRNLIHPLLEQTVTPEGEQKIAEDLNLIAFADREAEAPDKYSKIVDMLEEEVNSWER
jgi:hemerythrin-like domain-containing protein